MTIATTSVATSSTKTAQPRKTNAISLTVCTPISNIFSSLPLEIVRLVLEISVRHSVSRHGISSRRVAAFTYCFVSKEIRAWIEPVLYEDIVLESSKQVSGFLNMLEYKSPAFLARVVKSVSIMDDSFPVSETFKFERLFTTCLSLTKLVCLGSSMRILRTIPAPINGKHVLRELTIIRPNSVHYLCSHQLCLQKLRIVDYCGIFLGALIEMARRNEKVLNALRSIRQICLDSVSVPANYLTWELKHGIIPLLLLNTPGAGNTVSIHTIWSRRENEQLPDTFFARDIAMWIKGFDALVKKFEHRLSVTVEFPSKSKSEGIYQSFDIHCM